MELVERRIDTRAGAFWFPLRVYRIRQRRENRVVLTNDHTIEADVSPALYALLLERGYLRPHVPVDEE